MHETTTTDQRIEQLQQELAQISRELEARRKGLARQLEVAQSIHRSLLPQPIRDGRISVDVRYIPIEEVGGDYCQVRFSDRDTCYITMCDVTGHGIGPALLATRVSSEVRYGILYGRSPKDIVRNLNAFICNHFAETNLYLSFVVAQIDLEHRQITWSGAGHPSPLLIRAGGNSVEHLRSQNGLIGLSLDILEDEPEHTISLEPGDRLFFYTDGLIELANAAGRQLGTAGLRRIACAAKEEEMSGLADHVLGELDRYQHGPTTDDKTLIVAEMHY